jgi:thiamine pyrophosphokinase
MKTRLGIIFTGGEGPDPEAVRRLFETGMTAEALTVAADSGLILAESAGLKPDWVVGDMDSLNALSFDGKDRLSQYDSERVVRYNTDKDYTDTELAFSFLRENGCDEIWIVGGGGGRIDHLFGIRDLFEREFPPRRWITAGVDIYCVESGSLTMRLSAGALVSVFPLGPGPWKAESQGLKWPTDNVRWERGLYGLSNVAVEEEIVINAVQGRFMVIFNNDI